MIEKEGYTETSREYKLHAKYNYMYVIFVTKMLKMSIISLLNGPFFNNTQENS